MVLAHVPLQWLLENSSPNIKEGDPLFPDPTLYRSVVGALQYVTVTRPDVAFAVSKVSKFMHSPSTTGLLLNESLDI